MHAIRTALCAYGMSGKVFHGPLLEAHPGFQIDKILERHRNDSAERHPGAHIVRDLDSILKDDTVELVVVNTPDHLHYDFTRKVLEAGKHAVVEKPFTLDSGEAGELIKISERHRRVLSVFHNRRWDGDYLTVRQVLQTGKLGRLVDYESHFDRYRLEIQDSWKDRDTGTGTLYNLGSHLIDQAVQLFGLPDRLFCDSRMLRDGAKTDDSFDLFLHYDGFKCLLRSSYLVREPGPRFILHGTAGSYLKWGTDPQEDDLKAGRPPDDTEWGEEPRVSWGKLYTGDEDGDHSGAYPTLAGNYMAYYDNIHAAVRQGTPLQVTAEEAMHVVRIIELAYESSRTASVIRV